MPISLILALFALIALGAWAFFRFYSKHYFGEDAPEQSAQVTILDKQAIEVPDAEPGQDDQEYWIYVQRGTRLDQNANFKSVCTITTHSIRVIKAH